MRSSRTTGRLANMVAASTVGSAALSGPWAHAQAERAAALVFDEPRLVAVTDIGNEPDDSMSMVRLLTYATDFEVEGLIATTSASLRSTTHREMIGRRVRTHGEAVAKVRVPAAGYPDASQLPSRIRSGSAGYGLSGVGKGEETEAPRPIRAVPMQAVLQSGADPDQASNYRCHR
jgi:hypothetical protein